MIRTKERRSLAQTVGWLSFGLGTTALLAPRAVCRWTGLGRRDDLVRAIGAREVISGAGILFGKNPLPWTCLRVAGDLMDVAVLVGDTTGRPHSTGRMVASSLVAGIGLFDLAAVKESYRLGRSSPIHVRRTVTIRRRREELYGFWRTLSNLPSVFSHVLSVEERGNKISHWVVRGPAGKELEWDAEITSDVKNELISWRSREGASVKNWGTVTFKDAPQRGTEVTVELQYDPPFNLAGVAVATLLGNEPQQQVTNDLRQFKQLMETGEIATTEGQPAGRSRGETWLDRIAH